MSDESGGEGGEGGGSGKAIGGAALGVGGVLAMVLKLCSHDAGVAAKVARGAGEVGVVARGAGEVGAIGAAAGRGAGELGALGAAGRGAGELGALGHGAGVLVSGERGAGQLVLAGLDSPVEVSQLKPLAHAAEDGVRVGASGRSLAPGVTNGTKVANGAKVATAAPAATKAARASKLKDALEHASDAKDAVDALLTGWDLAQDSLDDDLETALDRKLAPNGLVSRDVVPALKNEPVEGVPGATRLMLEGGRALVPAAHLSDDALLTPLDVVERRRVAVQSEVRPLASIYVEVPSDESILQAATVRSRLFMANVSPKVEWTELTITGAGAAALPGILERGGHRFVRIATGGARVVVLRALPDVAK